MNWLWAVGGGLITLFILFLFFRIILNWGGGEAMDSLKDSLKSIKDACCGVFKG